LNGPIGVSFLIPAYNEATTIGEVLTRIDALGLDAQIVVVDDGSTDATASIVEAYAAGRPHVELLRQRNRGKGSAVRLAATRVSKEITVIQDADMEYDPGRRDRADRPDPTGRRRRRLRVTVERGRASARVHVLASRRQPRSVVADRAAVQHDAERHGDGL